MRLEEYSALRAEILKRLEFQNQLKSLTLLSAGAVTTVALNTGNPTILLAYPILVFFLALDWAEHNRGILTLAKHIQGLEEAEGYRGWETIVEARDQELSPRRRGFIRHSLPTRALFAGTQMLTLLLGLTRSSGLSESDLVLSCVSALSIVATMFLQHSEWFGSAREGKRRPAKTRT